MKNICYNRYMRKFTSIFFIFISLLILARTAFSQEDFNFDRGYSDYEYSYSLYKKADGEFQVARNEYLTYKTLSSKEKAIEATKKMLETRDEAVRTYVTALRLKLAQTAGVDGGIRETLFTEIDQDVDWHKTHREEIASAGTLADLEADSNKARDHFRDTEMVIYRALITVLIGKETDIRDRQLKIVSNIKDKVGEIRQNGDKRTDVAERWILEAENRIVRSKDKSGSAMNQIGDIKRSDGNKYSFYSRAQFALDESHQYLKEANSYLAEIVREIKTEDK